MKELRMVTVERTKRERRLRDVLGATQSALANSELGEQVRPGQRIALAIGSRGIACLPDVVRTAVGWVRSHSGEPFIVPAMGSHGSATAEGQVCILKELGIDERSIGAPILATMDVVELGTTSDGMPVVLDRFAAAADGIILINRIKPHTDFQGQFESGLCKLLAIGLGNHQQASTIHARPIADLERLVLESTQLIMQRCHVLLGLALIENHDHELAEVVALSSGELLVEEPNLLRRARRLAPRLPFDTLDVLIVDTIGKDISGTGMDTKVIGRMYFRGVKEPRRPRIRTIVALALTPGSKGNANGIGLADLTTTRMLDSMDLQATYTNSLVGGLDEVARVRIPPALPAARDAIAVALNSVREANDSARVARIASTLQLQHMQISEALLPEVIDKGWKVVSAPEPFRFDATGELLPIP